MNLELRMALKYLSGRKLRTLMTTLAVVFGVTIIFSMNGLLPAVMGSFSKAMNSALKQTDLSITSQARLPFDESQTTRVAATDGVAAATGLLVRPLLLPEAFQIPTAEGQPVNNLSVNGIDPTSYAQVYQLEMVAGRALAADDRGVLLVGQAFVEKTGLQPGSRVRLPAVTGQQEFTIAGVFASQPAPGGEAVYMPLADAQDIYGLQGQINTIEVRFTSGSDRQHLTQAVLAALGEGYKAGSSDAGADFMTAVQVGMITMNLFGVMALVMGGFIIFNTFRTIVSERRRDIGMLRAIGACRRTIIRLVLIESLIQGLAGTLVGLAAGYLLVVAMVELVSPVARELWGTELLNPQYSLSAFLTPFLLGIGVTILGGLQPALSATRITPLEALRPSQQGSQESGSRRKAIAGLGLVALSFIGLASGTTVGVSIGAVLFITGLVVLGPFLVRPIANTFGLLLQLFFAREGQIAQGNLLRQPGRASVTSSAMMISFAVLVALAGMVASAMQSVNEYVERSLSADFLILPQSQVLGGGNMPAGSGLAASVADTPGIGEITTLRLATTSVEDTALQVIGIDPLSYPRVSGLVFAQGAEEEAYRQLAHERAFIANGLFTTPLGLKVGDSVTFMTPGGEREYRLAAIATDYLNAKMATAYISQENLARDFNTTADVMVMANLAPGADLNAAETAVKTAIRDYPAFSVFSAAEWRERMVGSLNARLGVSYFLMILIGVPSLIALVNTLGINVIERTREIGVLRAVGAARRQIQRMITAESLLLSAAGAAFGILAGVWLSYTILAGLQTGGFVMRFIFPYQGVLVVIAAALLFGVFGALVPARQAARLNVIEALRYE